MLSACAVTILLFSHVANTTMSHTIGVLLLLLLLFYTIFHVMLCPSSNGICIFRLVYRAFHRYHAETQYSSQSSGGSTGGGWMIMMVDERSHFESLSLSFLPIPIHIPLSTPPNDCWFGFLPMLSIGVFVCIFNTIACYLGPHQLVSTDSNSTGYYTNVVFISLNRIVNSHVWLWSVVKADPKWLISHKSSRLVYQY